MHVQRACRAVDFFEQLRADECRRSFKQFVGDNDITVSAFANALKVMDIIGAQEEHIPRLDKAFLPVLDMVYLSFGDVENFIERVGLVLCNDTIENSENDLVGDPTETALVAYAKLIGMNVRILKEECPRSFEIPFV